VSRLYLHDGVELGIENLDSPQRRGDAENGKERSL
jgi:hypothetical protein